jgi:radical SAM superfamily enzyme YgiQ (UPF0313 family)
LKSAKGSAKNPLDAFAAQFELIVIDAAVRNRAMKKLLLVNPVGRKSGYLLSKFSTVPPLSLAYIAALTPPDWEVTLADENFGPMVYEDADLVGISAFTSNINRAYEIARIYRERETKVVIGGIHASVLPEEVLCYCDAVVIGEAENIWHKVLEDWEHHRLGGKYHGPRVDLSKDAIKPRRDLIDNRYFFHSIQTSRGCPFDCDFCTVSKYLGRAFRQRTAQDVLEELRQVSSRYVFFIDDNLLGHSSQSRKRARDIFRGMIDLNLKKRWWMQTSVDSVEDYETLKLAGRSGCMFAFIGFEAIDVASLKRMKKGMNLRIGVDKYRSAIDALHAQGIGVVGAFIIGNDHESPKYYKKLAEFIVRSGIDVVQIAILTPLPGTALMDRMVEEGRLLYDRFPDDWDKFRLSYVVHKTEGLDVSMIYAGNNYIKRHIYRFHMLIYRALRSLVSIKNPVNTYAVYRFNKALKKSWMGSHYFRDNSTTFRCF